MCLSCGCGKPNDRHGDEHNIALDDLKAAGEAGKVSPQEAAENIRNGMTKVKSGTR